MITILSGDITQVKVDAIVNAANNALLGGGGVDGAIHRVGGPQILADCKKIVALQGGCKTGEAVITRAGNLPAKFVIHTVGPVWKGGKAQEPEKLSNCYWNALQLATDHQCKSIAIPNISTGIYGFPKELAAYIAINTITQFIKTHPTLESIFLVCFDQENERCLQQASNERLPDKG